MRFNIQVALLLAVVMVAVVLAAPPSTNKKGSDKAQQQGEKGKSDKGSKGAAGKVGSKQQAPVKGSKPGQPKSKAEATQGKANGKANGKTNGKVKDPASDGMANTENKKESPRVKTEGAAMKQSDADSLQNLPSKGEGDRPAVELAKVPGSDFEKGDTGTASLDDLLFPGGSEVKGSKEKPLIRGKTMDAAVGSKENGSEGKGPNEDGPLAVANMRGEKLDDDNPKKKGKKML